MNLFLLPFAGGSKYAYWKYDKYASGSLNICPIEIPGRGSRINEALLTDQADVVNDIYKQIENKIYEPYSLYGHSMGGILCYELAKKIRALGKNLPQHLFITGCEAPSSVIEKGYADLPVNVFKDKLRELGGCPEDVLNSEELFCFYEPIIRADFKVVDSFRYSESEPLESHITIIIGDKEKITLENAAKWGEVTNKTIEVKQFPGNHFFIFGQEKEVMQTISHKLKIKENERRISVPEA